MAPKTPFTNIRIYRADKAVLDQFGGFTHEAFRKLTQSTCNHPEEQRSYVTGVLPIPGEQAVSLRSADKHVQVAGFFCQACNMYIFKRDSAVRAAVKPQAE